jgi:outer membrane protein OmpA-like peptidoglycan-associated protein
MIDIELEKENMKNIALAYKKDKIELNLALKKEFENDLDRWNAEILDNNTFRFKSPEFLFETGKSNLKDEFKNTLNDFFPRYISVLSDPKFFDDIDEIRIEGHTSSKWTKAKDKHERYINNARLSQERAFEVLNYCIHLDSKILNLDWLIKVFRANGLSFAKPIIKNGEEQHKLSRRVEFRVITRTEDKIYKIIEASSQTPENSDIK